MKYELLLDIQVTPKSSEIPMKSLVHHTISRTIEAYDEEISTYCIKADEGMNVEATFHFAAGQDSSSNHSRFNQRLDLNSNDGSLFAVQINPLCLRTKGGAYIYVNLAPQSPRSIRPQKLFYGKEDQKTNQREYKKATEALDELKDNYEETFSLSSGIYSFY